MTERLVLDPGSSPSQGHCVVFLGKTLYSYGSTSVHSGVLLHGYR